MVSSYAQDTIKKSPSEKIERKWNRTFPFELFSGYNFPQNSIDLSLKVHLINRKSIGYGMRYGRMKSAPKKMCLIWGNEDYVNGTIKGLKTGLDFTPFYSVRFSTIARHEDFVFSDFLYYTIGQLYIRANYVYYFAKDRTYSQVFRPEIGISPYFKLGEKRHEKLKEKGVYHHHNIYLHPAISYGYDISLKSYSSFDINRHHFTLGISISYEKVHPFNSTWPNHRRLARQKKKMKKSE